MQFAIGMRVMMLLHALMRHASTAATFSSRGKTSAAFSSPRSVVSRLYSTSINNRSITRMLVKVSAEEVDIDNNFYEEQEQVSFSNSNFHNDNLGDESVQRAQEHFQTHFSFPLDSWQLSAGASILADQNVIVCAPTG